MACQLLTNLADGNKRMGTTYLLLTRGSQLDVRSLLSLQRQAEIDALHNAHISAEKADGTSDIYTLQLVSSRRAF